MIFNEGTTLVILTVHPAWFEIGNPLRSRTARCEWTPQNIRIGVEGVGELDVK